MLLAGITTAGAATVVQNQDITNLGNDGQSYSWNAFNTALGTLTSAVFVVNGTYSGSFSVSTDAVPATISNISVETFFSPSAYTSLTTSPASGSTVPGLSTETFTIQGTPEVTINSGNLVQLYGGSGYFTGSSFGNSLNRYLTMNNSGGGSLSVNRNNLRLNGTISLTYTYTPSAVEPVPEISTVTMGGAGGLLLLGIAARSRRRQQPSDSVPA